MTRISRRHAFHRVNAPLLIAALACPAGLVGAVTVSQAPDAGNTGAPARATPSSPPAVTESPTSTPTGAPTPTPTGSGTVHSSNPPSSEPPSHTGTKVQGTTVPPAEQTEQVEDVTERLNEAKADVPEKLAPTIDALTNTLEAAEAPQASPQDRQGVIESARRLTTALTVIADDSTPGKLRQQLTTLVKQTSSILQMGRDPQVPPEQRSLVVLAVKRATSAVKVICDPETPHKQRDRQLATLGNGFYALRQGHGDQWIDENVRDEGTALATAADLPADRRGPLTETVYQHSRALRRFSDPRTSADDRAGATEDLKGQGARMGEEQEDAAPVEGGQDPSIAQEATVCTNAVFESVAEHRLARSLRRLVPHAWDSEGVKDFWKAQEVRTEKDKFLDVIAQLQNSQRVRAPVEIASLITEFTELVPRVKLYRTLGGPAASHCEQTASDLDQEYDVDVGNWLADSGAE